MQKFNIGLGITNNCNMNCKFCYSKDTRGKSSELKLQTWLNFVDNNHEYINSINYGTGENALRDDFFTLVKHVRANYPHISQSVTTNGYLFEKIQEKAIYRDIYLEGIDEVDVSLDFAEAKLHNAFRGNQNAYMWAMNGLESIKQDKKKATIVFIGCNDTLTKQNINSLFNIAGQFDALIRLNIYRPVSFSSKINKQFIVPYKVLIECIEYICENYKVVGLSDVLFGNIYTKGCNVLENTGINSIRILPDGGIYPSTYLISNNYKNNYSIEGGEILKTLHFDTFVKGYIPKNCQDCEYVNSCKGGVYDRRILWYGTLKERDPYCPLRNGDTLPTKKFECSTKGRISIHDGYLPTLFFKK